MSWSSAFYFGGGVGETIRVPIETITFAASDAAGFETFDPSPVFQTGDDIPAFDFTGDPILFPLTDGADFNVEC